MLNTDSNLQVEIQCLKQAEEFNKRTIDILEMIAIGEPASTVYDAIALLYESRHSGLRCSMLELENGKLLHGGAPSLPKEYCEAVHGLEYGPEVGSCGTATYTGERCIVENIETDPKWAPFKDFALPHGMRCCWSEPIKDSKGDVLGAFGMYYNHPATPNDDESKDLISAARLAGLVMERDHSQKRIRELAYMDTLTKLASRAYFFQYMKELTYSSKHHNRTFSLLYLDLDNFKIINDSQGHGTGDELLKVISNRLTMNCKDIDFIARLGGDEFCIVTEVADTIDTSSQVAQRCIDVISQPIGLENNIHTLTCSIGIAHYPDDGKGTATLLKAADTALYAAKELGKNRFALYEPELTRKAEYKFYFEQSLRDAIKNEELELVYQPKIDVLFHKVTGVEALSRWHHPKFGQVPPLEFIEVAERIGVIGQLTEWALYTACNQAVEWENSGLQSIRMSVNISPVLFQDNKIVSLVSQVINETGIKPDMLELEVTESMVQTDPVNLAIFEELRNLGVHLAIDDFGIGYSSFASLKHVKVDSLKIDKYFINDMITDPDSRYLVSSMIDIGHSFGYEIVAEGVETEEQLAILRELGCDTIQGYLFSRPVNEKQLIKTLKH